MQYAAEKIEHMLGLELMYEVRSTVQKKIRAHLRVGLGNPVRARVDVQSTLHKKVKLV